MPATAAAATPSAAAQARAVPGPSAAAPPVAEPQPVCTIDDPRLAELSGLVTEGAPGERPQRYHAIVDGGGTAQVFTLDPAGCAVTGERSAPVRVTDVEDLGRSPDGDLWLADIGDNTARRESVRLVVLPVDRPPRTYDLVYPDGPRDAEAVLVADDGTPLIVDKTSGAAGLYRPAEPLAEGRPLELERVTDVVLPYSATAGGPLGAIGTRTITGGAVGPPDADGGRAAALRTYTDAWLFPLPDGPVTGDVLVEALRGAPLQVPLPGEAQGEAVALDGRGALHSGTETRGLAPAGIRTVPGAVAAATAPAAPVRAQPAEAPDARSFPPWLPAVAGMAVVVGVLLAGVGAMALHGRRRR
ncbi:MULTISPECIES: hypothetical protein [Pseudonocardia]|uniref:hypothetical protein n=1 Tax=Pseudonocardia TaxID=1847 RepID=UPI000F774543|nr:MULTISPECIES: hypothetical protein [Pseudonocardia]